MSIAALFFFIYSACFASFRSTVHLPNTGVFSLQDLPVIDIETDFKESSRKYFRTVSKGLQVLA